MAEKISDPTFRKYNEAQATAYAASRQSYSASLTTQILAFHARTGGQQTQLLDVGCGPGNSTRDTAAHFAHATGLDPSASMIAAARKAGGSAESGAPIEWAVSTAETLDAHATPHSVDLVTAGTAAHWFEMSAFWAAASRALRPGGTVALWTAASLYCHPRRTPHAAAVQRVLSRLETETLAPHELPGNYASRTLYAGLGMPWDGDAGEAFPRALHERHVWNGDGALPEGQDDFFGGSRAVSLLQLEQSLGTASMVTRWREAHPELAGTDADCVKVAMRDVLAAMGMEGKRPEDVTMHIGNGTVLLLFKKAV